MGFFKDFKDDLTDAVDEIIPGNSKQGNDSFSGSDMINTLDTGMDVDSEFSKLDGLLEQVAKKVNDPAPAGRQFAQNSSSTSSVGAGVLNAMNSRAVERPATAPVPAASRMNASVQQHMQASASTGNMETISTSADNLAGHSMPVSDEIATITPGMVVTGDLDSAGSINVEGTINGNVRCNGKLTVTGLVNGNSSSAEFYADNAKISGEISTSGTVKIGVGSVVVGNIAASSAVIAGAVKGDIDVQGPVVVDTSAVVMGNIVSRSVQINNGAVIEGFCKQSYADVDISTVFNN